jgi:ADP-ribosylglycohydrolase
VIFLEIRTEVVYENSLVHLIHKPIMPAKTSQTHPLQIDQVSQPSGGVIGMTFCPGKKQRSGASGDWDRDLDLDLKAVHAWGACAVVSLMEASEFQRFGVPGLGEAVEHLGMEWHHLPIIDGDVPRAPFARRWGYSGLRLRAHLAAGRRILLHCRGGLGRTGMIAASLLVEGGIAPEQAILNVRAARPHTIETTAQEDFVRATQPVDPAADRRASRVLGCLLGGAVGDGFGYAVEFDRLDVIRRHHGAAGLREPVLRDGRLVVSDDTQMTLFTLEGLARAVGPKGEWHEDAAVEDAAVEEVRRAYLDWLDTQGASSGVTLAGMLATHSALRVQRAPGNTCLSALHAGGYGTIARPINDSKGCGGAMRTAPAGLLSGILPVQAFSLGARIGALTHGHPDGWGPSGFVAAAVCRALGGEPLERAIEGALADLRSATIGFDRAPSTAPYEAALHLARAAGGNAPADIRQLGGGWTGEEAAAIAAYAALTGKDFADVVAIAANHDGDSDSTASIAGQVWGAAHGLDGIPHRWVRRLDVLDELLRLAADPA